MEVAFFLARATGADDAGKKDVLTLPPVLPYT